MTKWVDPGQKPENMSGESCDGSAHLPFIQSHFGNRITLIVNGLTNTAALPTTWMGMCLVYKIW